MIVWYRAELIHLSQIIKKAESYIWLKIKKEVISAD